jgi:hypothetical protein
MTITTPPPAPSRNDPATFADRADAFVAWLVTAVPQFNALALMTGSGSFTNGSAASPSITFASDTNTGMYRIGEDILGFTANGVERLRVTTAGAQLTGLLTGTAVTQTNVDTTTGRLMKVGDAGILGAPPATPSNIGVTDNSIARGAWMVANTVNVSDGLPTNISASSASYLFHHRRTTDAEMQLMLTEFAANEANRCLWFRRRTTSAWGNWKRVYDWANVLGTVSQSDGVPTGALFQGNAASASPTGGYVELRAGGFQECHHVLTSSASADTTWTYNTAFLSGSVPVISIQPVGDADYHVRLVSRSDTACVFSIRNTSGARVAVACDLFARGRWSNLA